MKKLFLFLVSAVLLTACSEDDGIGGGSAGGGTGAQVKSTQVYVQGNLIKNFTTPSNLAKTTAYEGKLANAYYFIRIDNRIPELFGQCDASLYFPRSTSNVEAGSVFSPLNTGTVKIDYPYWNIADPVTHVKQYIYDTSGKKVLETLGDVPTAADLIVANQDPSVDFSKLDLSKVKILWYISKFTWNRWHVDGVLTLKSTTDITEIPGIEGGEPGFDNSKEESGDTEDRYGNIEVDIHQQEHNTWDEVKTSIHIRDLVNNVKVEIPIGIENVAESDDFAIRVYDLQLESKVFINGTEYTLDSNNPVKVTIEHLADKVVITASCTDEAYLNALREQYGDGVTIEVHTYPKDLSKADAWAKIKQSTVKVSPATYQGLIFKGATSAFFTE